MEGVKRARQEREAKAQLEKEQRRNVQEQRSEEDRLEQETEAQAHLDQEQKRVESQRKGAAM